MNHKIEIHPAAALSRVRPVRKIRKFCLKCCNGSSREVELCPAKGCPLWAKRFGKKPTEEMLAERADVLLYPLEKGKVGADVVSQSARKDIEAFCIDCSGGSVGAAKACTEVHCELHPLRPGTVTRLISADERIELMKRLGNYINKKTDTEDG